MATHGRKVKDQAAFWDYPIKFCFSVKPLVLRLARRPDAIFVNFVKPFERVEIGPDLFLAACRRGLEWLVSKRRDRPYQAGRSKPWSKVKNRKHAAMSRVMEAL